VLESLHDIFNIVVGVLIADTVLTFLRRRLKRAQMRKLNRLGQIKRAKRASQADRRALAKAAGGLTRDTVGLG